MKKILIIIFTVIAMHTASGQDSNDGEDYQLFAMIYTTGESWDTSKEFHEQAYFKEHSAFLSNLRKEERILIGGRYSDKGFMILKAKDEQEALEIISTDESVVNKTFNVEIYPFSVFYKGCLE